MRKNIWIFNRYATDQFINQSGRHYWFAEHLQKRGYNPVVFCANTIHNSNNAIHISKNKYSVKTNNSIPFVFVKTNRYIGNGINRIRNIINFYRNLLSIGKKYAKRYGKPDVIVASSVHP